jgi:hypothetical protein
MALVLVQLAGPRKLGEIVEGTRCVNCHALVLVVLFWLCGTLPLAVGVPRT